MSAGRGSQCRRSRAESGRGCSPSANAAASATHASSSPSSAISAPVRAERPRRGATSAARRRTPGSGSAAARNHTGAASGAGRVPHERGDGDRPNSGIGVGGERERQLRRYGRRARPPRRAARIVAVVRIRHDSGPYSLQRTGAAGRCGSCERGRASVSLDGATPATQVHLTGETQLMRLVSTITKREKCRSGGQRGAERRRTRRGLPIFGQRRRGCDGTARDARCRAAAPGMRGVAWHSVGQWTRRRSSVRAGVPSSVGARTRRAEPNDRLGSPRINQRARLRPFEAWQLPDQPSPYELPEPGPKKPFPWWGWVGLGVSLLLTAIVIAGFVIRVAYFTIAPGEAVGLDRRGDRRGRHVVSRRPRRYPIAVRARAQSRQPLALLAGEARRRHRPVSREAAEPRQTVAEAAARRSGTGRWPNAQDRTRTKVALEAAGYEVDSQAPGLVVSQHPGRFPAEKVLGARRRDPVGADGTKITRADDLGQVVGKHEPRRVRVSSRIERDGKRRTSTCRCVQPGPRATCSSASRFRRATTSRSRSTSTPHDIGGPSAGLAMSLAILDDLTPGELTGGKRVAVTGTIDRRRQRRRDRRDRAEGDRGRAAGAASVPRSGVHPENAPEAAGRARAISAKQPNARATNVEVVPVSTLDEALTALRDERRRARRTSRRVRPRRRRCPHVGAPSTRIARVSDYHARPGGGSPTPRFGVSGGSQMA